MAIRDFATSLVAFPDDRRVVRLQPALAYMRKRRIPAPGVDPGHAHAARGQIKRGLTAHAATGGEIFVGGHTTTGAGSGPKDGVTVWLVPGPPWLRVELP